MKGPDLARKIRCERGPAGSEAFMNPSIDEIGGAAFEELFQGGLPLEQDPLGIFSRLQAVQNFPGSD